MSRILFWIRSRIFNAKHHIKEGKIEGSVFRKLLQLTMSQILFTPIFAVVLLFVDPYSHALFEKIGFKIIDNSDYATFLATISGISGVFIGLYYAGISAIGSSIYAKVPNNIRDLLAQDMLGNVYMRFLSFLTFLGLILIAIRISGYPPIYSAVPLMTFLSGVGIISFVKLGQRAFNLFDPTELSSNLFLQLQHWCETVRAGKFWWSDKNFQHHAYKQSSLCLDALHTLSNITSKELHLNGKPFLILCKRIIQFLIIYEELKKNIPSDSRWYEQKYIHPDWYKTTDSHTSIAHQTGTALQPEVTNNKEWVEDRVIPILKNYLEVNLREERYVEVLDFTESLNDYLETLAKNGRADRALDVLEYLGKIISDIISPELENKLDVNEVLEKLAIIEKFSAMPTVIALECIKYIEKLDASKIEKKLSKIVWRKDDNLYKYEFPSYCLPRLEWLKSKLNFEISIEGHLVSPIWYQKELLLQTEADVFIKNTNSLILKSKKLYESWIKKTMEAKRLWLAGAVMSSEWGFWHKIDLQIEIWRVKWNKLNENLKIKELPWAKFEYEKLVAASNNRQKKLVELMSKQNPMLAYSKKPEGFPDYTGQFLHTVGEKSFDTLLTNNENLLSNIFEPYFHGCIVQFIKLKSESSSTDWHTQQGLKIAVAPLLDLIDISGYAQLMANYHGNAQLWEQVVGVWDEYFANNADKLPFFAAAIALISGTFEISHRSMLRINWKTKIDKKLSDVPRHQVDSHMYGIDTAVNHNSALIRTFAWDQHGSPYNGIDIFITLYLSTKEGAEELNFGRSWKTLKESLDREETRNRPNDK